MQRPKRDSSRKICAQNDKFALFSVTCEPRATKTKREAMMRLPFFEIIGEVRKRSARATVAAALLPCRFLLLFVALLAQDRFARQANLIALDGEHLDEYLFAQFQFFPDVADKLFVNFADVQQAVGPREDFHEGAEFRQPHHFAEIGLADFG